jgi:transcriptional regulator with XRE-family HTH domain
MIHFIKAIFWNILQYKDGIEIGVWLFGLSAILAAALQLAETKKQRGLSESFQIYEKIDEELKKWSEAKSEKKNSDKELGRILGIFEITSEAINKSYLSSIAKGIISSYIVDTLSLISEDAQTVDAYKRICPVDKICSSMKIFLLRNYKKVVSDPGGENIIQMVFSEHDRRLFGAGWKARALRYRRIIGLMFS